MMKWIGLLLSFLIGRLLHPVDTARGLGREAIDRIFDRTRVAIKVIALLWVCSLVFTASLIAGLMELSRLGGGPPFYVSPTLGTSLVLFVLSLIGFAYAASSRPWKGVRPPSRRFQQHYQEEFTAPSTNPLADALAQLIRQYLDQKAAGHEGGEPHEPRPGRRRGERPQEHFDA